jgi:hypothetical protein
LEPIEKFPNWIHLHSPNIIFFTGNPSRKGGDNPGAEEGAGGGQQAAEDLQAGLRIRIHFIRIRVRIQHFSLNADPGPIRIQGFNDQKLKKKITAEKKFTFFLDQKLLFTSP